MEQMFDRLDKMVDTQLPKPADAPKSETTPEPPADAEPKPAEPEAKSAEPKPGETPAPAADGKKPNPWKLMEEHKAARARAEAEIVQLRKLVPKPEEREAEIKRAAELEANNKALLEHLRFVDYQKHPEFQEKYEKPYLDSWNRIMKRLAGVGVADTDGNTRPVDPKDIAEISRLPADQAIELAEQKFGKLGGWVAERVEELRQLDEARADALENAKKEGMTIQKQLSEADAIHQQKLNEFLAETWNKATQEIETHSRYGEYFKPKEGDDEFNARLESATEKVDKYWGKSPKDPNLTPEQRAEIVKAHAAIRNRARGFGTQNLIIERLKTERDALKTELEQFKSSVPKTDGSQPENTNGQPANPWSAFEARMDKLVK